MTEAKRTKAESGPHLGIRWFGTNSINPDGSPDPVSITMIKQSGATDVITALYPGEVKPGEVWTEKDIARRKIDVEFVRADKEPALQGVELYKWYHGHGTKTGLTWRTAESLIFPEGIKSWRKGDPIDERDRLIDNYKQSLENLGKFSPRALKKEGIRDADYYGFENVMGNFMLMADWTRTGYAKLTDGSTSLEYRHDAFAAFDIFILKRHGDALQNGEPDHAVMQKYIDEGSYNYKEVTAAIDYYKQHLEGASEEKTLARFELARMIVAGLPGANGKLNDKDIAALPTAAEKEKALEPALDEFRKGVAKYKGMSVQDLRSNIAFFASAIAPALEKTGIRLCSHPDDPAFSPFMGTPRAVGDIEGYKFLLSHGIGVGLCPGSLMANEGNRDIRGMVYELAKYGKELNMTPEQIFPHVHLRPIMTDGKNFTEGWHNANGEELISFVHALTDIGWKGVYRPDHAPAPEFGAGARGYHGEGRFMGGQFLSGAFKTAGIMMEPVKKNHAMRQAMHEHMDTVQNNASVALPSPFAHGDASVSLQVPKKQMAV